MRPVAPPAAYAAVSLSNVVATSCQYEALRYCNECCPAHYRRNYRRL